MTAWMACLQLGFGIASLFGWFVSLYRFDKQEIVVFWTIACIVSIHFIHKNRCNEEMLERPQNGNDNCKSDEAPGKGGVTP